jgi:hypothetical protein
MEKGRKRSDASSSTGGGGTECSVGHCVGTGDEGVACGGHGPSVENEELRRRGRKIKSKKWVTRVNGKGIRSMRRDWHVGLTCQVADPTFDVSGSIKRVSLVPPQPNRK